MIEIPEIKNLISSNQRILLLGDQRKTSPDYLAAIFSLFYTLKKLGKIVKLRLPQSASKSLSLPSPIKISELKSAVLRIDNKAGIVSDVYYKKNARDLKFFLTLKEGQIDAEDISLEILEDWDKNPELIINIGIKSLEDLGAFYEENFKVFFERPIINVDNSANNQEYGKINLIESKKPFSLLAFNFIQSLNQEIFDETTATNLSFGILDYYYNMEGGKNADMGAIFHLKKFGPDFQKILDKILPDSLPSKKELGAFSLNNLDFVEELNLFALSPKENNLKKEVNIVNLIKMLRGELIFLPKLLVLWQKRASGLKSGGVFYSPNQDEVKKIATFFNAKEKKGRTLFSGKTNPLETNREIIYNLLREINL